MSTAGLETVTEAEGLRITGAFVATANALGDAIAAIKRIEAVTFDHDELDELMLDRRRLEDEEAANERSFMAYNDGDIGLHPPSQADVDTIVELAGEVARLTAKRASVAAIVKIALKANAEFAVIKGL